MIDLIDNIIATIPSQQACNKYCFYFYCVFHLNLHLA